MPNENRRKRYRRQAKDNLQKFFKSVGLPFPLPKGVMITEDQLNKLKNPDQESNNALLAAAKDGNKEFIDWFIQYEIDINYKNLRTGERAVDIAWDNRYYEVVLLLLQADSYFPVGFNQYILNKQDVSQKQIEDLVKDRNALHEAIHSGILTDVKRFTKHKSKFYLNTSNKSAALSAIKHKQYEIYAFLKSIGTRFINSYEAGYVDKLNDGEKDNLKKAMLAYFPSSEKSHVYYLVSKSRSTKKVLGFEERVATLYESLNAIPEVSWVMKTVQYADYLDIIFDFDNENIKHADPTAPDDIKGVAHYKDGRLYIAAKMKEPEILGNLAHELTHFAMQIIYNNDCNPYQEYESIQIDRLEEITRGIKETINRDLGNDPMAKIINVIFNDDYYEESDRHAELIVTIPSMLAQHGESAREWIVRNHQLQTLLNYYKLYIIPDCQNFIGKSFFIKPRNRIKSLNQSIGEINKITAYNIRLKEPIDLKNFLGSKERILLLRTKSTLLSAIGMYQTLESKPNVSFQDHYLLLNFDHYIKYEEEIRKIFFQQAKLLIVTYAWDASDDHLPEFLESLSQSLTEKPDKKIIFIVQEEKTDNLKMELSNARLSNIALEDKQFTWNNLDDASKNNLLKKEVKFQEKEISLDQLIGQQPKELIDIDTLVSLITDKAIKIGSKPLGTSDLEGAYAELFQEVNKETLVDKLLLKSKDKDIYIISGISETDKENKLIRALNLIPDYKSEVKAI